VLSTCPVWPVLTVRTLLPVPCERYREGASSCASVPSCLSLLRVPAFHRAHLCLADHVATSQRSLISRLNCFRIYSCFKISWRENQFFVCNIYNILIKDPKNSHEFSDFNFKKKFTNFIFKLNFSIKMHTIYNYSSL